MLHVTNGDSAGGSLVASGLPGAVVAWRDVLHEGPVPAGLAPEALREVRSRYLAERGWGAYATTLAGFAARDAALAKAASHDEVVLWFEHDLYDQLQLIQILDRLADDDPGAARLSLISVGDYPVAPRFLGLGQLTPAQLAGLFPTRQAVTPGELALGRAAWAAFRASDPSAIETLLAGDTSALLFLADALRRHLEEYPALGDGLARTEHLILETVAGQGTATPPELFAATQEREERPFMGDLSFWGYVRAMSDEPHPLLAVAGGGGFALPGASGTGATFASQRLALTATGREVLAGQADWIALHDLDRWYGGVRLQGHAPAWRWDRSTRRVVATGRA